MRLGSMQPLQEYKFIQELIIEGIWPFSRLRSPYNLLLLTIVYFFWGISLYLIFEIPESFLIAGTLAGIGISIWTYGILQYASRLRDAEIERMTPVKRKFLVAFMEEMFHDRSLFLGIIAFVITLSFLWTGSDIFNVGYNIENTVEDILQSREAIFHPIFLVYVFIIIFDVCYRFGLSAYISLVLLKRNFHAAQILRDPKLKKQIIPRDLNELGRVDRFHILSFASGLFFLPLSLLDQFLFMGLVIYLFFLCAATLISIFHLRILQVKAIPEEVIDLLRSNRFAYIGTVSDKLIPHVTPTLFVFDGRRVFFATSIKSQKVKNLRRHRDVAVCLHHEYSKDPNKNRGVLIRGHGRVYGYNMLTAIIYVMLYGLRLLYVKILFHRKYPEYVRYYEFKSDALPGPWRLRPILSRTVIEVVPRSFTYWEGTKFSRAAVI